MYCFTDTNRIYFCKRQHNTINSIVIDGVSQHGSQTIDICLETNLSEKTDQLKQ